MRVSKLLSLSFGSLTRIAVLQDFTWSRILMWNAIDLYELLVQSWWQGEETCNGDPGSDSWAEELCLVQSSPPLSNSYLPSWYNPISCNWNKYHKVRLKKKMENMCLQSWIDKMLGVAGTHSEEQAELQPWNLLVGDINCWFYLILSDITIISTKNHGMIITNNVMLMYQLI